MNKYHIINSAVLTSFGTWIYEPCSLTEAIDFIEMYNPRSTIRYEDTALALSFITGETITVRDENIEMKPGDEALVFRLRFPPGTPRIANSLKGQFSEAFILKNSEMGFLTRIK